MTDLTCTAEQADAITATGHTLLAANAGTGKTTTVIWKVLWHLGLLKVVREDTGKPLPPCPEEHRVTLDQIAAITFTEKAAYDLKRKLRNEITGTAPELLWEIDRAVIGTIHSFAGDLLREHALRFGIDPSFGILDERESRLELSAMAREVLLGAAEAGNPHAAAMLTAFPMDGYTYTDGVIDHIQNVARDLRWHRDRYAAWMAGGKLDRRAMERLAGCWDEKDEPSLALAEAVLHLAELTLQRWEEFLVEENLRDFDAMILDCRDRLRENDGAHALAGIRSRLRLFIIDEFQDTDDAQRDIAFGIAGIRDASAVAGPQLFMVGDPKQSIYGFRGADISVWNEVVKVVGEPLPLSRNFRSDPAIIDYVNRTCESVMNETAREVESVAPESRVPYQSLEPGREAGGTAELEWLESSGNADERRELEAEMVAARIRKMVVDEKLGDLDGVLVVDPESGKPRPCEYRDMAILVRARTGVECYSQALASYGVPFYLAGDAGLTGQLEILDLLNLLRLVANPQNDLLALAHLRSPFVGLRDETLARIRLRTPGRSFLDQAERFSREGDWFEAPEHADVASLEGQSLGDGIALVKDLVALRSRIPLDQLAQQALEESGYPMHLLLLSHPEPRLANLQRFLRVLADYRNHTVGSFLELWDRWEAQDLGIPQAPLYSKRDNVVTISTIHGAKGLEWPVVFLVDLQGRMADKMSNKFRSDRGRGPVFVPSQALRGIRTSELCGRWRAEETAEESRLFYVAATRARDRLILAGPAAKREGRAEWAGRGLDDTVKVMEVVPEVEVPSLPPEPSLSWLDRIGEEAVDLRLALPLPASQLRYTRSASELRTARLDREEWNRVYCHGVIPEWRFTRSGNGTGSFPADVRGNLIHGVLERIQEENEVSGLLDVVVSALDSDYLEERLAPGLEYREQLEEEIRKVVSSDEWRWYVAGENWRELWFVQFRAPRKWRTGAFDLYRPGDPDGVIVDFKTSDVDAAGARAEAEKYRIQAGMYRSVACALAGGAEVRFHFTRPDVAITLTAS